MNFEYRYSEGDPQQGSHRKPHIPFDKIVEGGVLQYEMGPEPGALWKN